MQVEFKKQYLEEYDLKTIVKAVHNLFDDYNYKEAISQEYLDSIYQHRIFDNSKITKNHIKLDTTYNIVENREKVVKYLKDFDRKLEHLITTLSEDEMKIYKYSIIAREQDLQIRDRICKTDKTYYPIKKSCYVKVALRFGLVDGFTKNIFTTISLID